ncbi:MAG TPA: Ldh family oxidoreductase [Limnochordales bacterium]
MSRSPSDPAPDRLIAADRLQAFCQAAFERAGMEASDAAVAAKVLVTTSLRGIDTHGVALLPGYVNRVRQGDVNPRPRMTLSQGSPATAVLDADNGLGVVAAYRAMGHAIELARQQGLGFVGVRRSTHFGAGAYYAMMALEHDMIGLVGSNGPPVMAPHGGARRAMHNLPLAAAIPTLEEPPIVMDFAMSVVAFRRVAQAAQEGRPIPLGWAVDAEGRPTTDAAAALEGALLPLGHKGYALGILVDVLSGVLSGAAFGADVRAEGATGAPQDTGHFALAIRVDAFMEPTAFKRRTDALVRHLRSTPPQDPAAPVRVPGERGAAIEARRRREGIPVPAGLYERLQALAAELGLAAPA